MIVGIRHGRVEGAVGCWALRMPVPTSKRHFPIRKRLRMQPLVLGAHHNRVPTAEVLRERDRAERRSGMHVQIADRFPSGIVHVYFELPLTILVADWPQRDPSRQYLG